MPGPSALDRPTFPDEFLDQCRSLVHRRMVSHGQHQRARLVLLLHESPELSNVAAGALVELHANSVRLWRHRWSCGDFSLPIKQAAGVSPFFPPRDQAIVKAIACEAVCQTKLPLSRLSSSDLAGRAATALGKPISPSTVWRILDADAIKPWRYEYWIFPRDPQFADKAGRVLDLYAGLWNGEPLGRRDYIISSDEKTSIQARIRCHATLPTGPGRPMRIEHEYGRGGALQYLAAWDVRRGRVLGRCESQTGIASFGRLGRSSDAK